MTPVAHIEMPYDRGHQWHLVVGDRRAVVSERTVFVLAGRFGVKIQGEPWSTETLSALSEDVGENYKLSKKARRMLIDAEIVEEYP